MFAVTVRLEVDPAHLEAFLPLMHENAQASLADEPGCHRFDVCTDPARPGEVFLYELYTDGAAFDAHLQTPHFKAFDAAAGPMILGRQLRSYAEVSP
jgi:quinol monooxygenase YgiN